MKSHAPNTERDTAVDNGGPQVWIVSSDPVGRGMGFEVKGVFANEHSALYHVEEQYGVAPVLDTNGYWNGAAAFGPQGEVAIQRFSVDS